MAETTKISWCHHTANFWWGCMKVSPGCKHCYAETLSKRWGKDIWGSPKDTARDEKKSVWKDILKWDEAAGRDGVRRRVFVSSMSDFLEDHPQVDALRERAKPILRGLKHLDVLMLTKRPENAERFLSDWYGDFPEHVWMGTTTENQEWFNKRLPHLLSVPAAIRFISVEPQIGSVHLPHTGDVQWQGNLHWVIVGGESGPGCRPFDWDWARSLRDDCRVSGTAFWMKQGGGHPNKRESFGDIPEDLRIRQLPTERDHA